MSLYFKPKDYLKNDGDKLQVQITSKGETKSGKYGDYTELHVMVGDEKLQWDCNESYLKRIKENGCGATFWIIAYKTSYGSLGYNFAPLNDSSANRGQDVTSQAKTLQKASNDDIQSRISRGAAWNNAVLIVLNEGFKEGRDIHGTCKRIAEVAEKIAPHQKAFVNGEAKEKKIGGCIEDFDVPPPKQYEPVDEHFDPVLDHTLPF